MKHTGLLFPARAIALPGSASADADLSKLPPPSSQKGLTFEKDIQPLFEASCTGCHGENKQKGDLRLDSLAAVLKEGRGRQGRGPPEEQGESARRRHLGSRREEDDTPKRRPGRDRPQGGPGGPGGSKMPKALTAEEVGRVRAWIDQGAK